MTYRVRGGEPLMTDRVRFAAIGLDHLHVVTMIQGLRAAGAECAGWVAREGDLGPLLAKLFADAPVHADPRAVLEDPSISLVLCAAAPDQRAGIACAAMRAGKDVLVDKPGAVSLAELAELRAVQAETGRRWVVYFSERLESRATVRACALIREGAIGEPLHVVGLGPHKLGLAPRPDWFFDPRRSGGILADLASHQVDQFLVCTGASEAEVAAAQVANRAHPERPGFEDVGELLLRSAGASGYARVDWHTPGGLPTWGDVRLTVVGTGGTLELRKNCDPAGREGGDHLFLVDGAGVRHLDCKADPLPFAGHLLADVADRGERAMPQAHAFRASELALRAQAQATRLGHLAVGGG